MLNNKPPIYSVERIRKVLATSEDFIAKSSKIINKYPQEPLPDSKGDKELNSFPARNLVMDAYMRGTICFESAADHFMAYVSSLHEPAKTLAPYTCSRSFLDASALALWLLELDIDAKERVGRSFAFRYKEFTEQIKFLEADKSNSNAAQTEIDRLKQRINDVEKKAISLGYQRLPLSTKGEITGIADRMPGSVGLIKTVLDKESEYRILSGVAHGYTWATNMIGFQIVEATDNQGQIFQVLEKHAHPEMIIFGINLVVPTFAKALWVKGKLFGWGMNEIEELLGNVFDKIGFNNNLRFWY